MPEELAAPPVPDGPPEGVPTGPPRVTPPGSGTSGKRGRHWPAYLGVAVTILVLAALFIAPFIHVPYVIIGPGDATPLDRSVVRVHGAPTYGHDNKLLYLTVTVSNRDPNLYRWLFAKLDPDIDVSKRQTIIGSRGTPRATGSPSTRWTSRRRPRRRSRCGGSDTRWRAIRAP